MRFLLAPQTNSFSHMAKCLAIRERLIDRGHEVIVAVGRRYYGLLRRQGFQAELLTSLQEIGGESFPCIGWFKGKGAVDRVLASEATLLRRIRPDRVLGIFRFTLKAAAKLADIPYDSLICGCMLPENEEGLGYASGEPEEALERRNMTMFFRYAGARLSRSLQNFGLPAIRDARELLHGERTFLWDFPEFMPLPWAPDRYHVGPVGLDCWAEKAFLTEAEKEFADVRPLAIVAFGTCSHDPVIAQRIVRVLVNLGYHVVLAAGGQTESPQGVDRGKRVRFYSFAPMDELFAKASLLVSHGGQMSIFGALAQSVPSLVIPFQPEQAHNGVCLERLGCGRRLFSGRHFFGGSQVYRDALANLGDRDIARAIESVVGCEKTDRRVQAAKEILQKLPGPDAIVSLLERETICP